MNQTNRYISSFLTKYVLLPDPRYAVLLTGAWGCGKTHFVKQWMNQLSSQIQEDETSTIARPVYVSLFGLSSIKDINDAVTREIYPFMKTKLYRFGKHALNAVSGVALKCDLSKISNDRIKGELNLDLDLISMFKSENTIQEHRIIVFDDLERCKLPMVELLGYINDFVEHSNIRVILVCHEDGIAEEFLFQSDATKKEDTKSKDPKKCQYDSFKEKVIGRTFQIAPDVEDAINSFCEESGVISLTEKQKKIAIDTFYRTKYENIRTLYQSLQDYCSLLSELTVVPESDHHCRILNGLLIQFIVAYSEYAKNDKVREITQHDPSYLNLLHFNALAATASSEESYDLIGKYETLNALTPKKGVFNYPMSWILHSVKYGRPIVDRIQALLNQKEQDDTISKRLSQYLSLENDQFTAVYDESLAYIKSQNSKIIEIVKVVYSLIDIDSKGICSISNDILEESKDNIGAMLQNEHSGEQVRKFIDVFKNTVQAELPFDTPERFNNYCMSILAIIEKRYSELERDEVRVMEEISDTTFDTVIDTFSASRKNPCRTT